MSVPFRLPDFGHAGHLGVQLLIFVQGDALIDKRSSHANLCLHLCKFVLNRLRVTIQRLEGQPKVMTKCP